MTDGSMMCTASAICATFFRNSDEARAPVDMQRARGLGLDEVSTAFTAMYAIAKLLPSWRPNNASFFFCLASARDF